ncbi:MAG TPA: hypothetical protein VFT84_06680, partial [Gemmatimonadales bacterium]|nr:hypothetical protein [Gemmatimonadales bacterium]
MPPPLAPDDTGTGGSLNHGTTIMTLHRLLLSAALALTGAPLAAQTLTGAGATFPNPIYTKWFD